MYDLPTADRSVPRTANDRHRVLWLLVLTVALGAVVVLWTAEDASASHYRYGTLSWEPTGQPNEVRFTGAQAWRASAFGSPAVGDIILGESTISAGDGTDLVFHLKVVSTNPVNDWFFGEIVASDGTPGVTYTYPSPNDGGAPWQAEWGSCCRISPHSSGNFHVNNPGQSERLVTYVDLTTGNSAPRTNLPPINPCPLNGLCDLPVPHIDPDGDTLSFRLASTAEAGSSAYVPPGPPQAPDAATIDPVSGHIAWDTNGATHSTTEHTLYSIQVVMEDGETQTPIDFFIELMPDGVQPPYWTPGSACGTNVLAVVGGTVTFDVTAKSDDAARALTLGHLGLPAGATFTHASPDNPVTGTFTWAPTAAEVGSYLFVFTAHDDLGYAAPSCPVTLRVVFEDPPYFTAPSPCGPDERIRHLADLPLTFPLQARSDNLSQTLTISLDSGPIGLGLASATPGNPATATASWPAPSAGGHVALFHATDTLGIRTSCRVFLDIVEPSAQTGVRGVWAGNAVPVGLEYESRGIHHFDTGTGSASTSQDAVDVRSAGLGLHATGLQESGGVTIGAGQTTSVGRVEIAELSLLGGDVVLEGLVHEAQLDWDHATGATLTRQFDLARLIVNGAPVPVGGAGPLTVALPGGGHLILGGHSFIDAGGAASYHGEIARIYLPAEYGRAEVIIGSLVLQGGMAFDPATQHRDILADDDARSGRDANAAAPLALGPGVIDGVLAPNDSDTYVLDIQHGEKVQFVLQPADHVDLRGGTLYADETPTVLPSAPGMTLRGLERLTLELVDPNGDLRDVSELGVDGGAERIEFNADIDGTWRLHVGRADRTDEAVNYTLATSISPVPLLPQNDALGGGDASATCFGASVPTIMDGVWPGVLRDDDHMDVYRFEADIGDLITVALKPGETADGVDMGLWLYDRSCSVIGQSDLDLLALKGTPEATLELPSQYTGAYYVGIERQNGVGNHYVALRVQDPLPGMPLNDALTGSDASSDPAHATPAPGPVFTGSFHEGDSGDAYGLWFDATEGEAYVAVSIGQGSSFHATLYDPNGGVVWSATSSLSQVTHAFQPTLTGTYVLSLQPMGGGGDYAIFQDQWPALV